MARNRYPWLVQRNVQNIEYAFFISHVGEDAANVAALKKEIERYSGRGGRSQLSCFLDVDNWPLGNVDSAVIRDYLLKSWHMVAWITPAYISNPRGWIWMELAYAELIELNANIREMEIRYPYIVPIFRDLTPNLIDRTPWMDYWTRKLILPNKRTSIKEIAHQLVEFSEQEAMKRAERP